jgi:hypothetical protein
MLADVLDLFERTPQALCAQDVAKRLGKDPSVVEGMLVLLVRMGKLVEVASTSLCDSCPVSAKCLRIEAPRRTYSLVSHAVMDINEGL